MGSSEEPGRKTPATEFRQPALESQPSVDCIQNRAHFQNPDYVCLHKELSGVSGEELNSVHAV